MRDIHSILLEDDIVDNSLFDALDFDMPDDEDFDEKEIRNRLGRQKDYFQLKNTRKAQQRKYDSGEDPNNVMTVGKNKANLYDKIMDPNAKNPYNNAKRDERNPDNASHFKVTGTYSTKEKGKYFITIYNVEPSDVKELLHLCDANRAAWYTDSAKIANTRENNDKNAITFVIDQININNWKESTLPKVQEVLTKSENYSDKDIQDLKLDIYSRVKTNDEINQEIEVSYKNITDWLNAFMQNYNSPEFKEIVKRYQRIEIMDEITKELGLEIYGHQLSCSNAARMMADPRKPTFILPEKSWFKHFYRTLLPGARPYYVYAPNFRIWGQWKHSGPIVYKGVTLTSVQDVIDLILKKPGVQFKDLPVQQKFVVNTIACDPSSQLIAIPEYDISDTVLMSNATSDPFLDEPGLLSNIYGELNQNAIDLLTTDKEILKKAGKGGKDKIEDDEFLQLMNQRQEKALINLNKYCFENSLKYKVTNDSSIDVINALNAIFMDFAKKSDHLKDAEDYAKLGTCFITVVYSMGIDVFSLTKPQKDITVDMMRAVMNSAMKVISIINKKDDAQELKQVDESENSGFNKQGFIKSFFDMCEKLGIHIVDSNKNKNKNTIKESFYKELARMDKSKTNLKN